MLLFGPCTTRCVQVFVGSGQPATQVGAVPGVYEMWQVSGLSQSHLVTKKFPAAVFVISLGMQFWPAIGQAVVVQPVNVVFGWHPCGIGSHLQHRPHEPSAL